jgi:hypothetical protein
VAKVKYDRSNVRPFMGKFKGITAPEGVDVAAIRKQRRLAEEREKMLMEGRETGPQGIQIDNTPTKDDRIIAAALERQRNTPIAEPEEEYSPYDDPNSKLYTLKPEDRQRIREALENTETIKVDYGPNRAPAWQPKRSGQTGGQGRQATNNASSPATSRATSRASTKQTQAADTQVGQDSKRSESETQRLRRLRREAKQTGNYDQYRYELNQRLRRRANEAMYREGQRQRDSRKDRQESWRRSSADFLDQADLGNILRRAQRRNNPLLSLVDRLRAESRMQHVGSRPRPVDDPGVRPVDMRMDYDQLFN